MYGAMDFNSLTAKRCLEMAILLLLVSLGTGCQALPVRNLHPPAEIVAQTPVARELEMVSAPIYTIGPRDTLLVAAIRMVPKSPYYIQPHDFLQIIASGTALGQDLAGNYQVQSNGTVALGPSYGDVTVADMTLEEAQTEVQRKLDVILTNAQVSVSLAQAIGVQQIAGEHTVGPDGAITLGIYQDVYVAGMTVEEAKTAIQKHLSQYLEDTEIAVIVSQYMSKNYFLIREGAGIQEDIVRFPFTGNETVLDALAQVRGTTQLSSTNIWVARPAPSGVGYDQLLPVDWDGITKYGDPSTNYQLFPNDRVFVAEDKFVALSNTIDKITAPFERIASFALLGTQATQAVNRFPSGFPQGQQIGGF